MFSVVKMKTRVNEKEKWQTKVSWPGGEENVREKFCDREND